MTEVDYSAGILKLLGGGGGASDNNEANGPGLKVIKVVTTEPAPYTFVFEGTAQALDIDLFEIPVSCYPLVPGDRLLVQQMVGSNDSMRWGALSKLTQGVTLASVVSATSVQVEGIGRPYEASDLVLPQGASLPAGYKVSLYPTAVGDTIKYAVLNIHEGG